MLAQLNGIFFFLLVLFLETVLRELCYKQGFSGPVNNPQMT